MITGKIDVTKIDKARLYKGEKGTYLSITLIPTPEGKYGDYMIVEEISKEEREAGKKGTILGNAKNLVKKEAEPPAGTYERTGKYDKVPAKLDQQEPQTGDDLPFLITIFLAVGSLLTYL